MSDTLLVYSRKDAEVTLRITQVFAEKYVQVNGLNYDRQEWRHYCLEKRRWARDDPSVVVPMPVGFR